MIISDDKVLQRINDNAKEKHIVKKIILSFFFGGLIGMFAQAIYELLVNIININEQLSITYTSGIIILIAFLLTCFGIFDKLALIAHSGVSIPISGFANSITSCALEGKSEGLIFGIGGRIFSLVGSVFTYGIVSSIFLGIIYYFYLVIK